MTCNVCQGERKVRLATFEELTAVLGPEFVPEPSLNPGYEEFPCPKCGPLCVKVERVGALNPGFTDYIKADLASRMGREMFNKGCIEFEERYDRQSGNNMLRATSYVAHPTIGRGAIEQQQQPKPVVALARQATEINDVKITIVFDPDVGTGRMATIQTEQPNGETRRFNAKVVDCSIRMQKPESYIAANGNPFQRRVLIGPQGFDLNVDLRCDGIDIGNRADVETPSAPETPRDPFAREIDFE